MKRGLLVAALFVACSEKAPTERPADEKAALGGEVAARVGGTPIPLSLVSSVANAQHIPAADAARRVIDDEIAAQSARAKGIDQRDPAAWNLTAARARIIADRITATARSQGRPTDAEVELLSKQHWAEVDRPPTMRVVHALVMHPKDKPELDPKARELAEQMRAAVADAKTPKEFQERAKAVPHDKSLEVHVEAIPPFTAEGLFVDGGALDPKFTAGARGLAVGETSGLVDSSFGYHVIRMVERLPPRQMALEDRRTAFAEEAYALRGHQAVEDLIDELKKKTPIAISPAAEQLMQSVTIRRDPQASLP